MDSELENMSTDDDLNNTVTLAKDNDNMYLDLKRADSSITIVLLEESNQKMNSQLGKAQKQKDIIMMMTLNMDRELLIS